MFKKAFSARRTSDTWSREDMISKIGDSNMDEPRRPNLVGSMFLVVQNRQPVNCPVRSENTKY